MCDWIFIVQDDDSGFLIFINIFNSYQYRYVALYQIIVLWFSSAPKKNKKNFTGLKFHDCDIRYVIRYWYNTYARSCFNFSTSENALCLLLVQVVSFFSNNLIHTSLQNALAPTGGSGTSIDENLLTPHLKTERQHTAIIRNLKKTMRKALEIITPIMSWTQIICGIFRSREAERIIYYV